jgi:hypothetical protein
MTTLIKEKKAKVSPQQFVTLEQFDKLTDVLKSISDTVIELKTRPVAQVPETKVEQEVTKAGPNKSMTNVEWEEDARTKIGEALDHCEVETPKNGGMIYTIVIKTEFSNANKEYLERNKTDRRSCEVSTGGFPAVQNWNKLVALNLKRGGVRGQIA